MLGPDMQSWNDVECELWVAVLCGVVGGVTEGPVGGCGVVPLPETGWPVTF